MRADDNWTGGTNTDWFTGSNWASGTVPTTGMVTVSGTIAATAPVIDGQIATADLFTIGSGDSTTLTNGSLTIQNGGQLNLTGNLSGRPFNLISGDNSIVTVTGQGSKLTTTNNSTLIIGSTNNGDGQGNGNLAILDGAEVTLGAFTIGSNNTTTSTLKVSGVGSMLTTGGSTFGNSGVTTALIEVSDGGLLVGSLSNWSNAALTVTGSGSLVNLTNGSSGQLTHAQAKLNVLDGATFQLGGTTSYTIGGQTTIDGAGSAFNVQSTAGSISFGGTGASPSSILTVSNNGAFQTVGTLQLSSFISGNSAILNIGAAPLFTAVAPGNVDATDGIIMSAGAMINFNHTGTNYIFGSAINDNATYTGVINQISGTTILTVNSGFTGAVTITGGILQFGNDSAAGSLATNNINTGTDATNKGTLAFGRSDIYSYGNIIKGTGSVMGVGSGTTHLTADNTYSGGTIFSRGTLSISKDTNLGDAAGILQFNGGTLQITNSINSPRSVTLEANGGTIEIAASKQSTFSGVMDGAGSLTISGSGTIVLTAQNTYTGGTVIDHATLSVSSDNNLGTDGGLTFINDGTLLLTDSFDNARDVTLNAPDGLYGGAIKTTAGKTNTFSGKVTGAGRLTANGAGTLVLTNTSNDYAGETWIDGGGTLLVSADSALGNGGDLYIGDGTLQFGAAFNTMRVVRLITSNSTINTNSFDGMFSGIIAGGGAFIKEGLGTLALTGDGSGWTGFGKVNAGILALDGVTLGGSIMVADSGALTGIGTIKQDVSIADNGTLQGTTGQTLTIEGNLTLDAQSQINLTLGMPSQTALYDVQGNVTLDGILNITDLGGFGPGFYRLISYQGNLTGNGLTIGSIPGDDPGRVWIDTDMANKHVNLMSSVGVTLNVWDGGDGVWNLVSDHSNDVWTDNANNIKGPYDQGSFAVFGGAPSTVTISNAAGNVTAAGLNFASDGHVLTGEVLDFDNTDQPIIRVGDSTATSGQMTATIAAELRGTKGINKTDYGTLVLTGANSYTGGTTVTSGVLQIGADNGASGNIDGNVLLASGAYGHGTLAFARKDATDFNGDISGAGNVVQKGVGTTTFTGDNSYSGGLMVEAGSAKAGVAGHAFGTGALKVKAGAKADLDGFDTAIGGLVAFDATDAVSDGDITLGSGKLTVEQSFDSKFSGMISGSGDLTKSGTGTLTLAGSNTYGGATNVDGGALKQGAAGVFNATSSGYTIAVDGTLDLGGFDTTLASLSNGGLITMGNQIGGQTLSVTGNYTGAGGMVVINTVLGDDNSKTDRLEVRGDTSGTTNLKVVNRGGLGAQTVNGIKVVEAAGQSNGIFSLISDYITKDSQKAVVAGAYAYTLHQGAGSGSKDGNWYLTSRTTQDPPKPDCKQTNTCPPDPDGPRYSAGVPVYEGYAMTLQALNKLPTLQQRAGNRFWNGTVNPLAGQGAHAHGTPLVSSSEADALVDQRGIWGRVEGGHNRFEANRSATGMKQDVNTVLMQAGIDGMLTETETGQLLGGFTAQYGKARGDIASSHGDGKIDTQGWGLGATLTWYGENGLYLDMQTQAMWYDSDLNSGTARQSLVNGNKGFGYALSFEAGKRIDLDASWSVTPQAQLVWSSVDFDTFNDAWGASVSNRNGDSLNARLGISADYRNAWRDTNGIIRRSNIYGIINLYQEFMGAARLDVAGVDFANDNDRTWGGIGAGGTYSWNDDAYALYGEGSLNTSLNTFASNYTIKGTIGFKIKW